MGRRRVDEARSAGYPLDDQALGVDRHRTNVGPERGAELADRRIARILDGDDVARLHQQANGEIDGLLSAGRDDDLVRPPVRDPETC